MNPDAIRLTDEEIAQACRDGAVWYPVVSTADRNIAQFAVHKVAKWLYGQCPHEINKVFYRFECTLCMQTFRQVAGLED